MQPVRKVLSATHFKPVHTPGASVVQWTPCSPGDPEAVEKTWNDVETTELMEPPLKYKDFVQAADSVRPTVTQDDIRKHVEWTTEAGEFPFFIGRVIFVVALGCPENILLMFLK